MTQDRRMTTDRFYGGVSDRLQNLQSMLTYIRDEPPTRGELNEGVIETRLANEWLAESLSDRITAAEESGT